MRLEALSIINVVAPRVFFSLVPPGSGGGKYRKTAESEGKSEESKAEFFFSSLALCSADRQFPERSP